MARGASVEKSILFAVGKVDGKVARWPVAAFVDLNALKPYAAALKAAYDGKDAVRVKELDTMSPAKTEGVIATDVKLTAQVIPYNPQLPATENAFTLES